MLNYMVALFDTTDGEPISRSYFERRSDALFFYDQCKKTISKKIRVELAQLSIKLERVS